MNEFVIIGVTTNGARVWDGRGFTGDKSKARIYRNLHEAWNVVYTGVINDNTEQLKREGYIKVIIREPWVLGTIQSYPGVPDITLPKKD